MFHQNSPIFKGCFVGSIHKRHLSMVMFDCLDGVEGGGGVKKEFICAVPFHQNKGEGRLLKQGRLLGRLR